MAAVVCRSALGCLLIILGTAICPSHGLVVSGTLQTKDNWKFVTRFCFLSEVGQMSYEIAYPKDYAVQNLIFYFDSDDEWPAVYPNSTDTTCRFKESVLNPNNNQRLSLTPDYVWSGCDEVIVNKMPFYNCSGVRTFQSMRERWWYIVVDNCNASQGLTMKYVMHMTNGNSSDIFFAEFSADEFYILQVDIAFIVVYIVVLLFTISVGATLHGRQMLHTTYKMFIWSVGLEVLSLVFMIGYYSSYANSGIPKDGVRIAGRVLDAASNLVFLLMLILMAKGYTITRGRLSSSGSVKISVFMTVYVVVYSIMFIWDAQWSDPGLVLYIYDSPPGYGLIGMQIVSWVWFCYSISFTLKHHPDRRKFYFVFAGFFTVWFWAGPVVILIAMRVMYAWIRMKVVNAVELCIIFCGHVVFLIVTRPSAANENFPYHIRTTQIGILTETSSPDLSSAGQGAANPYIVTGDSLTGEPNYAVLFRAHSGASGDSGGGPAYAHSKDSSS